MKTCVKCKKNKDEQEFPNDKKRKDKKYPYCKQCVKEKHEKIKKEAPEKLKRWRKSYNERHRMRLIDYRIKYYGENRETILKQERERYQKRKEEIAIRRATKRRTEEGRARARVHAKKSREKTGLASSYVKRSREKYPERRAVNSFVMWAVKVGVMKRSEICENCKKICKTQAHHDDYSKPMEVIWLCSVCHGERHRRLP